MLCREALWQVFAGQKRPAFISQTICERQVQCRIVNKGSMDWSRPRNKWWYKENKDQIMFQAVDDKILKTTTVKSLFNGKRWTL